MSECYSRETISRMNQKEWRALDVCEFARVSLARWIEHPGVRERVYAVVVPELVRKHLSHLDLVGEERAKVLFTILKSCCNRIVPEAIEEEMRRAH